MHQHRSTQRYNKNLGGLQERYRQQHTYTRGTNTPMSKMYRSSKQNINEDITALKNVLDQMNLINKYRTFHSKEESAHLFKCTGNIFKDTPHDRIQNKSQQIQEN